MRRISLVIVTFVTVALAGIGVGLWQKGYHLYVVHTGSMEPTLMPGDLVFERPADTNALRVGDIITFRHSDLATDVVTHRFIGYTSTGLIQTKGDANQSSDSWEIRPNQVEGREALTIPKAGYLLVFLKQPAGIAAVVTTLLGMMLLWGLFFPAQAQQVLQRLPGAHRRPRGSPAPSVAAPMAVARSSDADKTQVIPRVGDESLFEHLASLRSTTSAGSAA